RASRLASNVGFSATWNGVSQVTGTVNQPLSGFSLTIPAYKHYVTSHSVVSRFASPAVRLNRLLGPTPPTEEAKHEIYNDFDPQIHSSRSAMCGVAGVRHGNRSTCSCQRPRH